MCKTLSSVTMFVFFINFSSCSIKGGSSSLNAEEPRKPEFPVFQTVMPAASLKFIKKNGSKLCEEIKKVFVVQPISENIIPERAAAIVKISKQLCQKDQWVGYVGRYNIAKGTETFLAERVAYLDLVSRAMYCERQASGNIFFMQFHLLKSNFEDQQRVFVGPKFHELMQEFNNGSASQRTGFISFETWVKKLNEHHASLDNK